MSVVSVYNLEKEKVDELELNDAVFDVLVKQHVIHQIVVQQLAGRRSGTASTKTRAQVNASGAKLWRQKGTGRARVGSAAANKRRGGGVAFGPEPKSYAYRVSKKLKKAALRMALSDKAQNNHIYIVEEFDLPDHKTKNFVGIMKNFEVGKTLIVTDEKKENLEKSSSNVPWVKVMKYGGLNVYDLLSHDHLFLEKSAVERIEEALVP